MRIIIIALLAGAVAAYEVWRLYCDAASALEDLDAEMSRAMRDS